MPTMYISLLIANVPLILHRIKESNALTNLVILEYGGAELTVNSALLGHLGQLNKGYLVQFLGELEKQNDKVCLCHRPKLKFLDII